MTISVTNNSGATVYYIARKLISYSPNTYGWGAADASYNWTNWQAQPLANGATKSFSGDREAVLFHSSDPSSAINSLSAGDSFSADIALWKYGLQSGYTFDTGNGSSHNGGSNTWLAYKGSYNSPTSISSDSTAPTVSSVSIASATGVVNNTLNPGDVVSINAVFSESVNIVTSGGTPSIGLVVGSTTRAASYTSGSGSSTIVFNYTISSSDAADTDGISIPVNSLALNGGTIKDAAGNNAVLTHSAVAANSSFKVDTLVPIIDFISTNEQKDVFLEGDIISFVINFSESVTLSGGNMLVNLNIPSYSRQVVISPFSNQTQVTANYTVQAGDNVEGLNISSITLSAGSIVDVAGNTMSSFAISSGLNLSDVKKIEIKTTACVSGSVTKNSSDQIDSELVITRFESTSFDDCTLNQVPFRAALGGAPALRGQRADTGAHYHMFIGRKISN